MVWDSFCGRRLQVSTLLPVGTSRAGPRAAAHDWAALRRWRETESARGCAARSMGDRLGNAAAMAFNFTSAVGIILANKVVFQGHGFRFPTFMTSLHFVVTSLGVQMLKAAGFFKSKELRQVDVLPITLSFCSFVVFNNLSLQANSLGTYQLMKVMTTPCVVALQWALFGIQLPAPLILSLLPICIGVIMATVSDVDFNFTGAAWGVLGVLATCFYQLFVKTKQSDLSCSFFQLLDYQAPQAALTVLLLTPVLDTVGGESGLFMYLKSAEPDALRWLLLTAVLAFLVNLSTFLVISRTSPVTYQVLGHFKLVVILSAGVLVFKEHASGERILGMLLALGGIITYTTLKQRLPSGWEKRKDKREHRSSRV